MDTPRSSSSSSSAALLVRSKRRPPSILLVKGDIPPLAQPVPSLSPADPFEFPDDEDEKGFSTDEDIPSLTASFEDVEEEPQEEDMQPWTTSPSEFRPSPFRHSPSLSIPARRCTSALSFFCLFVDSILMSNMTKATHLYVAATFKEEWADITSTDIDRLFPL